MSTATPRPYRVTVALPRPAGDVDLVPPEAQVLAEAAAAAVGATDLMAAWTSEGAAVNEARVSVPGGRAFGQMGSRAGAGRRGQRDGGGRASGHGSVNQPGQFRVSLE